MEKARANKGMFPVSLRAALIGTALGTALVALFALILQKQWLGMDSIPYVNSGIKIVSAAVSALIAVRKAPDHTLLWGAAAGGLYMLISFVVFSLISGSFSLGTELICDITICLLAGAVMGIIRNLKR